jgi:hypothetical protein
MLCALHRYASPSLCHFSHISPKTVPHQLSTPFSTLSVRTPRSAFMVEYGVRGGVWAWSSVELRIPTDRNVLRIARQIAVRAEDRQTDRALLCMPHQAVCEWCLSFLLNCLSPTSNAEVSALYFYWPKTPSNEQRAASQRRAPCRCLTVCVSVRPPSIQFCQLSTITNSAANITTFIMCRFVSQQAACTV